MKVPFVDLPQQYKALKAEIIPALEAVMGKAAFIGGDELAGFEKEFAAFCGAKYAVGVGNGTDALYLALRAHNVGPGDEVITVPNTFIATVEAITLAGARPVFVDVNPRTYNMDVAKIGGAITEKTKAILPVHLYGQPAEMDDINKIARENNLVVIEDAAQAHGAEYKGKRIGSLGNTTCFSFYPGKNLGAYGDGGAVVTDNEEIANKVRMLGNHGRLKKYYHEMEGVNSRLDSLQAAVLRVKLKHLENWNELRRNHARRYEELLKGGEDILTPFTLGEVNPVYHLYVIRVKNRDRLRNKLQEEGISTGIHYPIPLHLQPAYEYLGLEEGSFPEAEKAANEVLSLPMFPELTEEQIEFVCEKIRN